jgi:hypothetical protein
MASNLNSFEYSLCAVITYLQLSLLCLNSGSRIYSTKSKSHINYRGCPDNLVQQLSDLRLSTMIRSLTLEEEQAYLYSELSFHERLSLLLG